ncbi:ketosteroid isomerase family protein [Mycobacterium sp. Y57]|uniref:nuclear transport factor 2 family protein n=1 Tax=Mycolicibacterium xanthum TaxID=2796469 RepID=UPI001C85A4BB|nr:nuclear transport factor 2 family protein [Mycolicibacterium xanthum]MBX7435304.1 ketosteroid isomerase family protein [Mycolicibacterium xanthum]
MTFTHADLLSAARRSLSAAGAHDRDGWIGLFTEDGVVEDPVGSRPHRGRDAVGGFYDTFIGPRDIAFVAGTDLVVDSTVLRDVELQIAMTPALMLRVPTFIRYDLSTEGAELRIAALSAYWELPAMIRQFAGAGPAALPAGIRLGRAMLGHQGLTGCLGFLRGFRGMGGGGRTLFTRFLDSGCGGDEIGLRRLAAANSITEGDTVPLTCADLLRRLSGGRWDKLIRSGRSAAARVERAGVHTVLIGEFASGGGALTRVRVFGETG